MLDQQRKWFRYLRTDSGKSDAIPSLRDADGEEHALESVIAESWLIYGVVAIMGGKRPIPIETTFQKEGVNLIKGESA